MCGCICVLSCKRQIAVIYSCIYLLSPTGKCLYLSGLIPEPMNAYDDYKLKEYGIGFTNIVERTSRGSVDLTK